MLSTIGLISIIVGAFLVYGVLVKKFPQLKLIDLSTLAKERNAQVKKRIIKDRFDRSLAGGWSRVAETFEGLGGMMRKGFGRMEGRLKEMEKGLERPKALAPEERKALAAKLTDEARALANEGKLADAEARYIEILKHDGKAVGAYLGLADLYIAGRQFDQARQTLEFLVRMDAEDGNVFERFGTLEAMSGNYQEAEAQYLKSIALAASPARPRSELGQVYLAAGEAPKAWEQFKAALEAEPYNPRYLDYFLESSILIGDSKAAEEAFEVLETANPENRKLAEFRERIDLLKTKTPT